MMRKSFAALMALGAFLAIGRGTASAGEQKLIFASPGIPPIFATLPILVAVQGGFFKKYGADVEVKNFDSGTVGARAVVAGDADFDLGPSVLVVNQISNANVPLVAIYGMENPDFVLATTNAGKADCKDTAGQGVGVDTPGGQRSIMLKQMLLSCGAKIEDVQQVALGSNTAPAMIAGQISYGVLHIDDIAAIEEQGKKVTVITTIKKANPNQHNILGIARIDRLKEKRDQFVRMLAGLIAATRYLKDPKNADRVAEMAAPTGRSKEQSKKALVGYLENEEWPLTDDGMSRARLEKVIENQVKIGGIQPGRTPVTYDRLVDGSVWRDAAALVDKNK